MTSARREPDSPLREHLALLARLATFTLAIFKVIIVSHGNVETFRGLFSQAGIASILIGAMTLILPASIALAASFLGIALMDTGGPWLTATISTGVGIAFAIAVAPWPIAAVITLTTLTMFPFVIRSRKRRKRSEVDSTVERLNNEYEGVASRLRDQLQELRTMEPGNPLITHVANSAEASLQKLEESDKKVRGINTEAEQRTATVSPASRRHPDNRTNGLHVRRYAMARI